MSRTIFTLRVDAEERLALENLSRIEGRPMTQLVNDAIISYVRDRKKQAMETNLSGLRSYRQQDPTFEKAVDRFVEAEASLEDPIEGELVEVKALGPVQRKIRNILEG